MSSIMVALIATRLGAQPVYYATDLGTLPGGTNSQALAMNNAGQVVGWSSTSNSTMHAFLYSGGTMIDIDLDPFGVNHSVANAINNSGQVAGQTDFHAFLYSAGGLVDLDPLIPSVWHHSSSAAYGLNDKGEVVGQENSTYYWNPFGFVYSPTWTSYVVGQGQDAWCDVFAINNSSIAVGYTNFWQGFRSPCAWGAGAPSLSGVGTAFAINDNGQILGSHDSTEGRVDVRPTGLRPFLYNNGTTTDLSMLMTGALGLNNNGLIVGYTTNGNGVQHAALYSGGAVTDLNDLIDTNSGFTLVSATAINDNDSIVGYGATPSGQEHAFLLTLFPGTPPTITSQPQGVVVQVHGTASFNVTATSLQPLSYQWRLNGMNIPGAILSSLVVSNVVQANLGAYSVLVRNQTGSVISSNAVLSMPPFITVPFKGAVTYWGEGASLSIQAWGSEPLMYQWLQNGVALPGATNQVLSLPSVQYTNRGFYSVIVSNAFGCVTNTPAEVVVLPAGISLALNPSVIITGIVGYVYAVQSSTNLGISNSWVTATNFTLSQPIQIWTDTSVNVAQPGQPYRYYRVLPGW